MLTIFSTFLQNKLLMYVMCVSINKQLIHFKNCFAILTWLCQGKDL